MSAAQSKINPSLLDQALVDIRSHISNGEHWQSAMRQLSSIKDYSMGEQHLCSSQSALENCEQIKGYFPDSTPGEALANIDRIIEEIRQLQKEEAPDFTRLLFHPLFVAGAITAIFYFLVLR